MGIVSVLKPGLFIYECVRITLLAFTLIFILPGENAIPWLAFVAPGALFPLMALFLWLDISRYKAYLPLFIAGKFICIFSLICWSVFSSRLTLIDGFSGYNLIAELVFLSGDLFALAAVLFIFKDMQKLTERTVLTTIYTPDTEEE